MQNAVTCYNQTINTTVAPWLFSAPLCPYTVAFENMVLAFVTAPGVNVTCLISLFFVEVNLVVARTFVMVAVMAIGKNYATIYSAAVTLNICIIIPQTAVQQCGKTTGFLHSE